MAMRGAVQLSTSVPTQGEFTTERKTSKLLRQTVMGNPLCYYAPSERIKLLSNAQVKKVC
jgi:hypothetical protein